MARNRCFLLLTGLVVMAAVAAVPQFAAGASAPLPDISVVVTDPPVTPPPPTPPAPPPAPTPPAPPAPPEQIPPPPAPPPTQQCGPGTVPRDGGGCAAIECDGDGPFWYQGTDLCNWTTTPTPVITESVPPAPAPTPQFDLPSLACQTSVISFGKSSSALVSWSVEAGTEGLVLYEIQWQHKGANRTWLSMTVFGANGFILGHVPGRSHLYRVRAIANGTPGEWCDAPVATVRGNGKRA
jgi:hypothetical protein